MIKPFTIADSALVPTDDLTAPVLVAVNPDAAEAETLKRDFDIDEHSLVSAFDPDEESRIEIDGECVTIIWKRPKNYSGQDNFYFNVGSVGLFLAKGRLAVVLTDDVPLIPPGPRKPPKVTSTGDALLAYLAETTHHYIEHLKVIKMISRDLQQKINTSMENKHLIQMFNLSESLVYYTNAINGNLGVLNKLQSHAEKCGFSEASRDLIDDLIIETHQCFRQTEIYATVFSGLMDARGSLVNNNMNVLLRNLTIINIVFLPLNLLAGIGGMSEFTMMTQGVDWRLSYAFFILGMVALGLITAWLVRRIGFPQPPRSRRVQKPKPSFLQPTQGSKKGKTS